MPATLLVDQIIQLLGERGSLSAAELRSATGKSQASISIALTALGKRVCRMGAARSTRYALTQDFYGLAATQPLFFTSESGVLQLFGEISHLENGSVFVRASDGAQWLAERGKLPWFLQPLRPQGFLGREYLRVRPDFPSNPDLWTTEQVLYLATNHATDPPGAFSLGESTGRVIRKFSRNGSTRIDEYDGAAVSFSKTLPAQSSAGGEQPKFLAEFMDEHGKYRHLIVKFSPPRGTPFGERWHALLHLEALALTTLGEHGIPVAPSVVTESATRTYLESQRFDRIGIEGKHHVVSIDALHDHFVVSPRRNWVHTCEALAKQGLLSADELAAVARIYAFGQFIGNTDMHFGNLSFYVDDVLKPRIRLAPVYDMLPMMWRPTVQTGELDATPVREQPHAAGHDAAYDEVRQWAVSFWRRASTLEALTSDLQESAARSAERVSLGFKDYQARGVESV